MSIYWAYTRENGPVNHYEMSAIRKLSDNSPGPPWKVNSVGTHCNASALRECKYESWTIQYG